MSEFNKIKYNAGYNKENYKQISFRIQNSKSSVIEQVAKKNGYDTINAYAKALLEEALEKELRGGTEIN